MTAQDAALELIDGCYEAATDPAMWPRVLERITHWMRADIGEILLAGAAKLPLTHLAYCGRPPQSFFDYEDRYQTLDPRLSGLWNLPAGKVVAQQVVIADREFFLSQFYNDFFRLQGVRTSLCGFLDKDPPVVALGLHRNPAQGQFDRRDVEKIGRLVPHLRRSLRTHLQLREAQGRAASLAEALDLLAIGVVTVDSGGRPLFVNRGAQSVAAARDGFALRSDGLGGASAAQSAKLSRLIAEAARAAAGRRLGSGGAMALARPSSKQPYIVRVAPLDGGSPQSPGARARAAVLISDPGRMPESSAPVLQRLFDLTPAQARLAARLAGGQSLEQAAGETGVTIHTARFHLKGLFARTATRRQGELVALLLRSLAGIGL